jgi:alginate O-acetyltransferase complex protein AlgI
MLFNSLHFLIFFPIVWIIYHSIGKYKNIFLLLASLYFYMAWNSLFIFLLTFSIAIDYFAALSISNLPENSHKKKLFLILSLVTNLGFLGYFKYTNFLFGIWNDLNINSSLIFPIYNIVLPVGISFYTFQSMSYTIDVYRGTTKAKKSLIDFALYVSFFPQLVAGPIVRAETFFRDLYDPKPLTLEVWKHSVAKILIGFTKKVVFADNLALTVDRVFSNPSQFTAPECWIAMFAFIWQIYFDFSGYTDIAIGVARLFGFQFDINFYFPFNVSSLSEHWSRWHISFTTWIRDYIFIPLGGSRVDPWKIHRNVFITFLFAGLWHGAAYQFLVWGMLHFSMLQIEREYTKTKISNYLNSKGGLLYKSISRLATILFIVIGIIFFRGSSISDAVTILKTIFNFTSESYNSNIYNSNYIPLIAMFFIASEIFERFNLKKMIVSDFSYTLFLISNFLLIFLFGVRESQNFIYFAF